jgi:hypothetical protein
VISEVDRLNAHPAGARGTEELSGTPSIPRSQEDEIRRTDSASLPERWNWTEVDDDPRALYFKQAANGCLCNGAADDAVW